MQPARGRQRPHRHSEALTDFFARLDPPADDEDVIVYCGDMETLATDLRQAGDSPTETATGTSDLRLQLDVTTALFTARRRQLGLESPILKAKRIAFTQLLCALVLSVQ